VSIQFLSVIESGVDGVVRLIPQAVCVLKRLRALAVRAPALCNLPEMINY
jgi:hypothetical protein